MIGWMDVDVYMIYSGLLCGLHGSVGHVVNLCVRQLRSDYFGISALCRNDFSSLTPSIFQHGAWISE